MISAITRTFTVRIASGIGVFDFELVDYNQMVADSVFGQFERSCGVLLLFLKRPVISS